MTGSEHDLHEQRRIEILLVTVLEAAQGGGMSSERAEAIYEDICDHYRRMREGFCQVLAQELRRCLAMTDKELDS